MTRRIAGVMAILGFALACLLGAVAGCSLETALFRAVVAMAAFFALGLAVGHGANLLMREHFRLLARSADDENDGEAEGQSSASAPPPTAQSPQY